MIKKLALLVGFLLQASSAFSQGVPLPIVDTVGTLNQVEKRTDGKGTQDQHYSKLKQRQVERTEKEDKELKERIESLSEKVEDTRFDEAK